MRVANEMTRRRGTSEDMEFLFELLRRALGPHVEATYEPWDDDWQRRNFWEKPAPRTTRFWNPRGGQSAAF